MRPFEGPGGGVDRLRKGQKQDIPKDMRALSGQTGLCYFHVILNTQNTPDTRED